MFGVPFILIGLGMLSTPLWAYRKALRMAYLITNKRAISLHYGKATTIQSYPLISLQEVYRKEMRDGSGDVILKRQIWQDSEGERQIEELGFMNIRNANEVASLIRKLAEQRVPKGVVC